MNPLSRYKKHIDVRNQSYFLPGPVDPRTGNYTPSQAEKDGVEQWPRKHKQKTKQ
jgi:hypothetical protein